MRKFIINENDSGQRVDKFLQKAVFKLPKTAMYKFIRTKKIKLNRKRCEISTRLQTGDILELYIDDSFFEDEKKQETTFLRADEKKLNIIYEDENIIILFKETGLPVHADDRKTENLLERVQKYLYLKGEYNPETENSFAPSVCNRLDRNTCGLVISAKNSASLREINRMIKEREIKKIYLCLTNKKPPKDSDIISAYLKKSTAENKVSVSATQKDGYKPIITEYKVVGRKGDNYILEINLVTGRTHQIRASLAFIGCSIVGDTKYNGDNSLKYQALCAYKLLFQPSADSKFSYLYGKSFEIPAQYIWFL